MNWSTDPNLKPTLEPMTNKLPRHNFTAVPGLALCTLVHSDELT